MESETRRPDELEDQIADLNITETIISEIQQGTYTCLVCTCEITPEDSLWSCSPCSRVYHLDCISHWSTKGSSTDANGNWNCPSCNHTHRKTKFQYKCWCGKVIDPQTDKLHPGSCGQTCGAKLKGCVHRCSLPCHPGPHAACNSLGPVMKCHCGNHENQWPCVLTPYKTGWHCDDACNQLMPCEIHKCSKVCHNGLCGKCNIFVEATCYCGNTKDKIKCFSAKPIECKATDSEWMGLFKCKKKLEIMYDCKIHNEIIGCQKPFLSIKHCPLSPNRVKNCHCGKTSLKSLNIERMSCTDPIPICEKECGKKLPCGHKCLSLCHEGPCGPCYQTVESKCQCQLHDFLVPCKFNQSKLKPTCSNKCFALLSCRRHRCENICCIDFKTAQRRERERKKNLKSTAIPDEDDFSPRLNSAFNVEATHICLRTCFKALRCGNPNRKCQLTCHTGPCPSCLESTNEDLVCNCGQTIVHAPIRCGTVLPECRHQCIRPTACGHEPMPHNCHPDEIECPKCTKTVEKRCNCGKNVVKAMCFQNDVFCLVKCDKYLPCLHECTRSCHSGACEYVKCPKVCGKKKPNCSHIDTSRCHFPARCDDIKKCNVTVTIKCKCGRIVKNLPCGANRSNPTCEGNILNCEVSCVLKQREEQLKEAFGIISSPSPIKTQSLSDIPYDIENVIKVTMKQSKWCLSIEEIFITFMKNTSSKRYNFNPMVREKRRFLYFIAEAYGIDAEAQDPEPHRSITLNKTVLSKIPSMRLSEAIKLYLSLTRTVSKSASPSSTLLTPPPEDIKKEIEDTKLVESVNEESVVEEIVDEESVVEKNPKNILEEISEGDEIVEPKEA